MPDVADVPEPPAVPAAPVFRVCPVRPDPSRTSSPLSIRSSSHRAERRDLPRILSPTCRLRLDPLDLEAPLVCEALPDPKASWDHRVTPEILDHPVHPE